MRTHFAAACRHETGCGTTPVQPVLGAALSAKRRTPNLPSRSLWMSMSDENGNETTQLLRKEFHVFWSSGLRGRDYLAESAAVVHLDLNDDEITVTRTFHCSGDEVGSDERAEDLVLDWLHEDSLVQNASSVEATVYLNYSPLRTTADGLMLALQDLQAMGKEVTLGVKFAELYKAGPGEEDSEENREGLRVLDRAGVSLDVMKERDWLFLMQTLTKNSARGQQADRNAAARQSLGRILRDPHDEETSTSTGTDGDCDGDSSLETSSETDLLSILGKDTTTTTTTSAAAVAVESHQRVPAMSLSTPLSSAQKCEVGS